MSVSARIIGRDIEASRTETREASTDTTGGDSGIRGHVGSVWLTIACNQLSMSHCPTKMKACTAVPCPRM
jgi:hypothetical protein